jgi:HEAT repeat protein
MLSHHMSTVAAVGQNAEEEYQASLQALRAHGPEAVEVLHRVYVNMDETRYFARWALVETLRELRSDSALQALTEIASVPVPKEKWTDPEASSRDQESHIRVTAVVGIADLAKQGNRDAEQALTRFLTHEDLSVRREAIRGYLGAGKDYDARASYLRKNLSERDQSLINLNVTEVKQVRHPDIPESLSAGPVKRRDTTPRVKR